MNNQDSTLSDDTCILCTKQVYDGTTSVPACRKKNHSIETCIIANSKLLSSPNISVSTVLYPYQSVQVCVCACVLCVCVCVCACTCMCGCVHVREYVCMFHFPTRYGYRFTQSYMLLFLLGTKLSLLHIVSLGHSLNGVNFRACFWDLWFWAG